ncbi:HEAT repeat domain-containing protein [Planomonospora sp. ID67723]|uniref:HEAT repeat domain-containing protein n=1 Tax=Planomonospora sp. ID67723 TaxID=2738134 RepID=UPI0018C3AD14|nr:HEAT repeat domain-containing protein [Planomonospora sp. ID67723]MBG0833356.1 HEAT repeat domain-containing protein [Planomonospora sp. ID67723]
MNTTQLLSLLLAALAGATTMLGLVIVAGRALHRRRVRRDARLAADFRPLLLELIGGDDDIDEPLRRLAALDRRRWRAVEPSAISLLTKVSGHARTALVKLFEQRGLARTALRDLTGSGAVRRATAAHVLGLMGHAEAAPALAGLLSDRSPEVRAVAARALGQVGAPEAAGPLLASLAGGGRAPFYLVTQSLIRLGPGARPALVEALSHEDAVVRAAAAEVLGLTGAVETAPALIGMLVGETSTEVQTRMVRSLGRLGTPMCLQALIHATGPGHPHAVRVEAAAALGVLGSPRAVPALGELLGDSRYHVAHNAARSLARLGDPAMIVLAETVAERSGTSAAEHAWEALAILDLQAGHLQRPPTPAS